MAGKTMEGSMSVFQGFTYVLTRVAVFVGMVFAARYVNLAFDKIHSTDRKSLPPGGDKPPKIPGVKIS
jgi:hypothetical protein